jgi:hypothetical protein
MNSRQSPSASLPYGDAALPRPRPPGRAVTAGAETPATLADRRQRSGERMIVGGFAIAIVGVVAYCLASFAAGINSTVDGILFNNDVPFVRATLVVLGVGTLVWLAGSITYLKGALEADEDAGPDGESLD